LQGLRQLKPRDVIRLARRFRGVRGSAVQQSLRVVDKSA
jgi:hypothetical protein